MKVVAHPLLVAAALGLLGPAGLEGGFSGRESTEVASDGTLDPEEIARAERLWVAARDAFDAEQDE